MKARREKGLCARYGCRVVSGDEFMCANHKVEFAAYMRRWRKAKREARAAAA